MSGGRPKKHEEEEHENHERWLVSYADMITVLMALFIVLFAMSQVDAKKFADLAAGLADGFGNKQGTMPLQGGAGILSGKGLAPENSPLANSAANKPVSLDGLGVKKNHDGEEDLAKAKATQAAAMAEYERLKAAEKMMIGELEKRGLQDHVKFRINERGLVAAVVSDDLMFENGSAVLRPKGQEVVMALAPVLVKLPDRIVAEGHANHLPMPGDKLNNSNMHLSGARAATVVQYLVRVGELDPKRINSAGFGDSRPLWKIEDPRAITGNRRVDLVLLSAKSLAVRSLLPQMATGVAGQKTPVEPGEKPPEGAQPPEPVNIVPKIKPDLVHTNQDAAPAADSG